MIGAGIAGCAVAYELASAGARVVVAERGAVCSGSSALNAGGIRQQFSQEASVRAGMEAVRRLAGFKEEFGGPGGDRTPRVYTIAGFSGRVEPEGVWGGSGIAAGTGSSAKVEE